MMPTSPNSRPRAYNVYCASWSQVHGHMYTQNFNTCAFITNLTGVYPPFPSTHTHTYTHTHAHTCTCMHAHTHTCANTHTQLLLWESYEGDHVCGGIRYQPHIIKPELVESFGKELCQLISAIAKDPCKSALKFAQAIHPPFLNAGRTKRYRSYRKPTAGL